MSFKIILGAGAILDGVCILATQYFGFPSGLHYLWASLAIIWGVLILNQK
jgi:hypothetical protein